MSQPRLKGFYGYGVTESHAQALVAQASVQWAKTESISNQKTLDIAPHPTNDLLGALRQVICGLASVK